MVVTPPGPAKEDDDDEDDDDDGNIERNEADRFPDRFRFRFWMRWENDNNNEDDCSSVVVFVVVVGIIFQPMPGR